MNASPPKVKGDTLLALMLFLLCCVLAFMDKAKIIGDMAGTSLP